MDRVYEIIKRHLLTEKTTMQKQNANVYSFEVLKDANKQEIKYAIEKLFDVKVAKVNTMVVPGRTSRIGRYTKKSNSWKKAVVTLAPDQKIATFDNI